MGDPTNPVVAMVQDQDFTKLPLPEQRKALTAHDPLFGNVSDDDLTAFVQAHQATPGPKGFGGQLGDLGKETWNQVNPINTIKGARDATAHPINTLVNDHDARQAIYSKAEESFKSGDYAGGAAHLLYSFIPGLGPQLDSAGEDFAHGDWGSGAGKSIGMGLNMAGPSALKGVNIRLPIPGASTIAEKMYQSALKPSTTLGLEGTKSVVQTGLRAEIPVSEAGATKLASLIDDLNTKISDTISRGQQAGAKVTPGAVVKPLADVRAKFAQQVNPVSDVAAVDQAGQEFFDQQRSTPGGAVKNLTPEEAQAVKVGTYRQLRGKYDELSGAAVEAQKALARGIKEELEAQFPEIKGLNAQDAKFIALQPVLDKAVTRISNHNLISLGGRIGSGAAGLIVSGGGGGIVGGAATATASLLLNEVLTNPALQSRLAWALNKGGVPLPTALARVQGYVNAVGQSANEAKFQNWRNQNFRQGADGNWESPGAQSFTDQQLRQKFHVQR